MLKCGYRLLVVLLVFAFAVGCRQRLELVDAKAAKDTSLEPIDLLLKIAGVASPPYFDDPFLAPQSQVISQDEALGITITRSVDTRTPEIDEVIKDLNIFLFHKERDSIVRHYYIVNPNPASPFGEIHLDNLYVGNYELYVVANNGRSLCDDHRSEFGCTHRRADMADMMSSVIPVGQTPYFNLMVYWDSNFWIKRATEELTFTLQRLTARFDVELVNNWSASRVGQGNDFIMLNDYSIINMPIRAKLFGLNRPLWSDLDLRANITFSDDEIRNKVNFAMLGNMQGNVTPTGIPSYIDRNASNAPTNASCLCIYATYDTGMSSQYKISYLVYLGGPGSSYQNYDVLSGTRYTYVVTLNKPDFTDPRLTSFSVTNETSLFSDGKVTSKFEFGTVISRPLEVIYSRMLNDELYITCELMESDVKSFSYSVYSIDEFGGERLIGIGSPIVKLLVPPSSYDDRTKMARAKLRIEYVQNRIENSTPDTEQAKLKLSLDTKNGQYYLIFPKRGSRDPFQVVSYYYTPPSN